MPCSLHLLAHSATPRYRSAALCPRKARIEGVTQTGQRGALTFVVDDGLSGETIGLDLTNTKAGWRVTRHMLRGELIR